MELIDKNSPHCEFDDLICSAFLEARIYAKCILKEKK